MLLSLCYVFGLPISALINRKPLQCSGNITFPRAWNFAWDIQDIFSLWFGHKENRDRHARSAGGVLLRLSMHSTARNSLGVFCVSRRVVAIYHKCSVKTNSVHLQNLAKYTWLKKNVADNSVETTSEVPCKRNNIRKRGRISNCSFRAEQNSGLLPLCSVPSDTILQ